MLRFRSQRIASESGYTLIELLVVTLILMILSLFAVPIYDNLTDKVRLASSLQDMRVIEQALEAHRADEGFYPTRLGALTEKGYLRSDATFRSPWSSSKKTRYYFYAIDHSTEPHAFILGDPGPNRECSQSNPARLYASNRRPVPCGTNPKNRARIFTDSEEVVLITDSGTPSSPPPTLAGFRAICDPQKEKDLSIAPGCIVKTES